MQFKKKKKKKKKKHLEPKEAAVVFHAYSGSFALSSAVIRAIAFQLVFTQTELYLSFVCGSPM